MVPVQKSTHDKTAAKKAAVLGTDKKSRLPLFAAIVCAALIVGVTYYFIPSRGKESYPVSTQTSSGVPVSEVTYPVSFFDDGKARHFVYKGNDVTIKYFILKSSDGVIRAAFDACDVCWSAGKGYYQDGDYMVCRNCGRRFASVLVNVVQGGCNPAPLKRAIENDNLVIDVNDILEGKHYFDL
jgi:uncharacterized membrane protein